MGIFISAQEMLLGLVVNVSEVSGTTRWVLHGSLLAGTAVVLFLLGVPMVRQACACAVRRRPAMEWLFLSGIVGALGASIHATLRGNGAVYYEVVAVLLTVYSVGRALTAAARRSVLGAVHNLETHLSRAQRIDGHGGVEDVPTSMLRPGDRVRVPPGGVVTVDGWIRGGQAWIQESAVTGRLEPRHRRIGDPISAGMISADGELEVEVGQGEGSRALDALMASVRTARAGLEDSPAVALSDRVAAWFLPLVAMIAGCTWFYWFRTTGAADAWYHALSVLLVACPCALGLAVPLGLWSGLGYLASRGIVLKSASALERLADVRQAWFDKTGTLTSPEPILGDWVVDMDAVDRQALRRWVSAIERRSGHPLARAFATDQGEVGFEVQDLKVHPGAGVEATVVAAGVPRSLRVGRRDWIAGATAGNPWQCTLEEREGDLVVAVALDGRCVGLASIREQLAEDWEEVVARLDSLGIRAGILSGDSPERLQEMGASGRVQLHGGLMPAEKAAFLERIQGGGGKAVYLGDGVNDGGALAAAHVGLAMGHGTALARDVADGSVTGERAGVVVDAIEIARDVRQRTLEGFWFAGMYNVVGMALAAAGLLHPVVASLLMVGSSSVVAWRAVGAGDRDCGVPGRRVGLGRRWGFGLSMAAQVALGVWLGALDWRQGFGVVCVGGILAWWASVARRWRAWEQMLLGMAGPAGLLMLVGWWADAGFGRVVREGVCLCCQSHHYFELGGRVPWMYLGMLAGGTVVMWEGLPRVGSGGARWPAAILAGLGMVLGMNEGVRVVLMLAGPGHPAQFVLAWGAMQVGMVAGMFLGCGVAEVFGRWLRTRG